MKNCGFGGRVARFSLGVIGSVRRQAQEAPALTGSVLYSTPKRPGVLIQKVGLLLKHPHGPNHRSRYPSEAVQFIARS